MKSARITEARDETDFHETRDTAFLLTRLEELWKRVPRYKPLSVGVVLLDLVRRMRLS
jgi:hypothetical protein